VGEAAPAYRAQRAVARAIARGRQFPLTRVLALGVIAGFAVLLSVIRIPVGGAAHVAPVYSVNQVQRQVAQHPLDWLGRTIQVRGYVVAYGPGPDPFSASGSFVLSDGRPPAWTVSVPLIKGPEDRTRALLRRLPVLSGLFPRAQRLNLEASATYRVHLRGMPQCATCFEVEVLDAS
jgi:hypothetical protein